MEMRLKQIAERIGGQLRGDGEKIIRGIAPFESAGDDQITFAEAPKYLKRLHESRAGAFILPADGSTATGNPVWVNNSKVGFAKVLEPFYPPAVPFEVSSSQAVTGRQFRSGRTYRLPRWHALAMM